MFEPKVGYVTVSFRVPVETWEGVTKMTVGEALEVVEDLRLTKGAPIRRREEAPSAWDVFVRCLEAGRKLYNKLLCEGVDLVGVGVGMDANFRNRIIALTAGNDTVVPKWRVPREFEGFEVTLKVRKPSRV